MGQISNPIVLEKALRTTFMKAFDNQENPADVMPMITESQSTSNKEKYGWLGEVPQLREWIDERKISGLNDYDYEIANKDYEATLQVNKNDLDDDQYNHIIMRTQDLGRRAKTHPRKLFFDTIIAGETALCFDGLPFYSTSHVFKTGGTTQSNLHTGTKAGTIPTTAELAADFIAARAKMMKFVDDQGEPLNEGERKLHIVASPDMQGVLDEVFGASLISNTTNTLKGAASYMTSGRLTGADFYMFDINVGIQAIIKQNRQAPNFEALEKGSEGTFFRKQNYYGIDYRVGFGYGLWSKSIKVKY